MKSNISIKSSKRNSRKASSSKTLIESLTAKLNLAPSDKTKTSLNSANNSYNGIGSLFKTRKATANQSPINKLKVESLDQLDSVNNDKKANQLVEETDNSGKGSNWKAANFSLYGLDIDDDEKSSVGKCLNERKQLDQELKNIIDKDDEDETGSSLPLPPPPIGFDDNNNIIEKVFIY